MIELVADEYEAMIDINTTPLIDVLLVLLVMLIITIPVQLHAVNIELPVSRAPNIDHPTDKVRIDIDAQSRVHWQGLPVQNAEMETKMADIGSLQLQPDVLLRTDKDASYSVFAGVLASSRRHGLNRIAVIGAEQFSH